MNTLFKKLVDNFTFGEILTTKTTAKTTIQSTVQTATQTVSKTVNSNTAVVEKPENKAKDKYMVMIIRKGKVVGWSEF